MPLASPSALKMVEAVRAFMEKDILKSAKGRAAFDVRVAINALKIVERELEGGSKLDSDERKRLVQLLQHEGDLPALNEELAQAIRQDTIDLSQAELFDHLLQTTMGKMQIDNPNYSTYKRLKDESSQ